MIKIEDKTNCTGCTACYCICPKSAITMLADNEGFLYPLVNNEKCIDCGLCENVCPIINYASNPKNNVLSSYVAHHIDKDIWYKSSSGGAFTAITDYIYSNKGVVFGATYNSEFEVVHEKAESIKEAIKFRTSKYVQSRLGDTFKQIKTELLNDQLVLFSGTPCQVEGLKSYLKKEYKKLLTVDLICHCVPSPLVFKDYINYIETKYGRNIIRINMKDKTQGWPVQSPRIYFEDGSSLFNVKDSYLWEAIFYSYLAIRPSCHKCRFSNLHRAGDITIGDYWGVEKYHLEYNKPLGASLILINTGKGIKAFNSLKKHLQFTETDVIKALPNTLLYSTKPNSRRKQYWDDYNKLSFEQQCSKYLEPRYLDRAKRQFKKLLLIPIRIIKHLEWPV